MASLEHLRAPPSRGPAPALGWHLSVAGELDRVDAGWLRFTGRSAAEEIGEGWKDRVHIDDLGALLETARAHVARREAFPLNFRLLRHDGEYRWLQGRVGPLVDERGEVLGFAGNAVDIDDRLARSGAGADDFFELSLDNLCVAGLDGYFRRVNPSWTRTLGWSAQELLASPTITFVHPDDRAATLAGRHRLQLGSPMGPLVNRYRCKDGSYRWLEWRSFARAEHGLVYASARDVTEQRLAAQQLAEGARREAELQGRLLVSNRMASVGTLAAGVAHEINNPLAYVVANLALILEALAAPGADLQELRELADEAHEGAQRIRKIVRSLSVLSRAEEERRSVVELSPLVALSIDLTANAICDRGRLTTDYGPTPRVEADEARLAQVFVNLLLNAAQALPEDSGEPHEIRVSTSTDAAGNAVVEVRDSGVGIPAEALNRVFDPFFTTQPIGQGPGLGLSICHSVVTSLGGSISARSEVGKGTTVRVVLPGVGAEATASVGAGAAGAGTAASVAADAGGGPSAEAERARPLRLSTAPAEVLVVDDDVAVGVVLARILRDHHVTTVTSAREALALLAAGRTFDVVFSDLMMPEMSGIELYEVLTQRFPIIAGRVVFMSGGAFTSAAREFIDRMAGRFIGKPFDAARLRGVVTRTLEGTRARA